MAAPKRNYDQSMGLWINEPAINNPASIDKSINTLAENGYTIIRLFLRHTNFSHRSPLYMDVVRRAVELAHKRGMRAVLDCEPHTEVIGRDMGTIYPKSMGSILHCVRAKAVDGRMRIVTEVPGNPPNGIFDDIEAAFVRDGSEYRSVRVEYNMLRETHAYDLGKIRREHSYVENSALRMQHAYTLDCRVPELVEDDVLVFLRYSVRDLIDYWAPEFLQYCSELVDCYKDIPLDGMGWDEPAANLSFPYYRYGAAFKDAFKRENGYDITSKLYCLEQSVVDQEAVKVRLDYYRTLNEGLARSQASLIKKTREVFGDNVVTGTHHTWQGEGGSNDYRAGAVDYFRLNDNMDAGYTDCSWWDQQSVSYSYALASSMGRLTPTGEAVANTWHFKPTVLNSRRNIALMSLMNITWFNIWFGSDCDCIMQEGHYTWPETVKGMKQHQERQRMIGKRKPKVNVAIWHGWEGVCAWNSLGVANVQKAFCLNTSHLLIEKSIAADFIDSRLLADSKIENGKLANALGSYSVLILPYAIAIPAAAWDAVKAFANVGGNVIFVGTPSFYDENGNDIAGDWASLLQVPPMSAAHYMTGIDAICTLPSFRPQQLEVCRPLPSDWPRVTLSCEGEPHAVTNKEGNVLFLSDLDPKERLPGILRDMITPSFAVYGQNVLCREYGEGDDSLLVVATSDAQPMSGIIEWRGLVCKVTGGLCGILTVDHGKPLAKGDLQIC